MASRVSQFSISICILEERQTEEKEKTPMITIDMHSHIEIREVFALLPEAPPPRRNESLHVQAYSEKEARDQLSNPDRRIADMEKAGISMTILSNAPGQFLYNLEGNLAVDVSRKINDGIAAIGQRYPTKLLGMAHVPLQNIEASVSELERAVRDLKLKGVHVASNVMGRYLGDRSFLPFFEKVAALDVPVFVHPTNVAGADRMREYYFGNLIGNPLDTTIAAGTLIFSGIFDRLPGLKIILAHAGGFLPYNIDRWSHGFVVRPECREFLKNSPEMYMKHFYYDTISHGPVTLRFLISRVGAERVLMATDYPYDMGDMTPLQSIQAAKLSARDKERILSKNCHSLFKIG
ncbi:amidohydrolase family protein [Chloroflexota bacterium]